MSKKYYKNKNKNKNKKNFNGNQNLKFNFWYINENMDKKIDKYFSTYTGTNVEILNF